MGFRIGANVSSLNAQAQAASTNRNLTNSLEKLSSGLRINKAADDASGMAIADSLRGQAAGLGQAVTNANDAIGIVQIADKAMDEQIKILETIKTKALQSAQDGQNTESRAALQKDVNRLMEELDNIANTTNYNGQNLLGGGFTNKEFQIGAYSNQTVTASIGSTHSSKIGSAHYETGLNGVTGGAASTMIAAAGVSVTFSAGERDFKIETVNVDYSAGSGLGALADAINRNSDATGINASISVRSVMSVAIGGLSNGANDISGLKINDITIGNISGIKDNDADGRLVNAINALSQQTGVQASVNERGALVLESMDGRAIKVSSQSNTAAIGAFSTMAGVGGVNIGRLTLSRKDAKDIVFTVSSDVGDGLSLVGHNQQATATMNLADVRANVTSSDAQAIGAEVNSAVGFTISNGIGAGLTSLKGAMSVMDIAESAQKALDTIRSDLGSVQNQLVSTINNISVTQVNVMAAESNIRDVDFAKESANFSKQQILAQAGSYAMSQANAVQQNVMRLLQ